MASMNQFEYEQLMRQQMAGLQRQYDPRTDSFPQSRNAKYLEDMPKTEPKKVEPNLILLLI